MTKLTVTIGDNGKLCGLDAKGQRAYDKFLKALKQLRHGDTLGFSFFLPRDPASHRAYFRKLQMLLERTETFSDLDKLRAWISGHRGG